LSHAYLAHLALLADVSLGGILDFLGPLVFGAVIAVVIDHLLTPALARRRQRHSVAQARRHRKSFDYAGRPLEFDGVDVGVQVLFGTLGRATRQDDVQSTLVPKPWTAPADLRDAAALYAARFGFYDGKVARLNKLDVETYAVGRGDGLEERHRLRLEIVPTGYFDMLATNVALGPFTPATAPLLGGRGGLAATQLSNMMGMDLTLITTDGDVPVFFRSARMAALERCWQTSSGETVQLPIDQDTDGRPNIFMTARRGLQEELGIAPELIDDLAVTAFVATPEYANVGVLMFATLPLSTREFEARLNHHVMAARDNWEYSRHQMIPIDDVRALASALTDGDRRWTKQAVASLIFAHAYRVGNVLPLAEAIKAAGALSLEAGSSRRDVLDGGRTSVSATPYCWKCGSALSQSPPTTCGACGQEHYVNPKPCGEAVVVHDGQVLLVRRARAPWRDRWDLPGGFCDGDEHPMHAAERELREELGLVGEAIVYLGTWMDVYEPPVGDGQRDHTANSAYLVRLDDASAPITTQPDEVAEARWFPLDAVPPLADVPQGLAFPNHLARVLSLAKKVSPGPRSAQGLVDRTW
jgi:8-oxo-dGTP diphosphatase